MNTALNASRNRTTPLDGAGLESTAARILEGGRESNQRAMSAEIATAHASPPPPPLPPPPPPPPAAAVLVALKPPPQPLLTMALPVLSKSGPTVASCRSSGFTAKTLSSRGGNRRLQRPCSSASCCSATRSLPTASPLAAEAAAAATVDPSSSPVLWLLAPPHPPRPPPRAAPAALVPLLVWVHPA